MSTVLVTYQTPPPPRVWDRGSDPVEPDVPAVWVGRPPASVASTLAGVDEAIAATIAEELSLDGHLITCRPGVATPVTGGYDLVVDVDRLRVTYRTSPAVARCGTHRGDEPAHRAAPAGSIKSTDGQFVLPVTWATDRRAMDAWARTIGDILAGFLELRTELTRARAALERCRSVLQPSAAPLAEPRSIHSPDFIFIGRGQPHVHHRAARLGVSQSAVQEGAT
jgi:hypothetical protein